MNKLKPYNRHDIHPPKCRGQCIGQERPCLAILCVYHMASMVGSFKSLDLEALIEICLTIPDTCCLDIIDRLYKQRGHNRLTLEEVGQYTWKVDMASTEDYLIEISAVTRQRSDQIEKKAYAKYWKKWFALGYPIPEGMITPEGFPNNGNLYGGS